MKWRLVCQYFGLDGVGPQDQPASQAFGIDWLIAQKDGWPDWVLANGLEQGALENVNWDILAATLTWPMRIDYDLTASRDIGFTETLEPGRGYILAFDRLVEANFLPSY